MNGVQHKYVWQGSQLVAEYYGGTELEFFYDESGAPYAFSYKASASATPVMYYYVTNLQGDVTNIVDASGNVNSTYTYNAWGKIIFSAGTMSAINPIRYRGYYYDTETGLYYLRSRYYDPEICRLVNADGEISGVGGDVLGYNMFAYCMNNPVNMDDLSGNWPKWATKLVAAVAVVAVAAVVATVTVATLGAGTAVACVAVGAAKGAAIGLTVGAVTGALTSAVAHRVETGGWSGAEKAAIEGAADGALSGAVTGTITGGINSNVCFVAGTSVLTSSGLLSIEEIKVGDRVWAQDIETGINELKEVVHTFVNETKELVHVFVNGEEIVTTPSHPFYSPMKGWIPANKLCSSDLLAMQNGNLAKVDEIQFEICEAPVLVYNFEVSDFHNYFVGECAILVHNVCKPVSPVKVSQNALKEIDVHAFKQEFVRKNIAHWDVFKDTANNSVLWLGNKAQNVWHETGMYIDELIKIFPKR